ncbi:MAG: hypothetical protein OXI11_05750, partial [Gammaproteobacteria bacterium]|nr:hypothetical protein [Gammaproteobacteria bacterium]
HAPILSRSGASGKPGSIHGLYSDSLIERLWRYGSQEELRKIYAEVSGPGIICQPSSLGAELFLWAFGHGNAPIDHIFSGVLKVEIDGLPKCVLGAVGTKS